MQREYAGRANQHFGEGAIERGHPALLPGDVDRRGLHSVAMVAAQGLIDRFQPLLIRGIRWLSRPGLPPNMADESINLAAEAMGVLGVR